MVVNQLQERDARGFLTNLEDLVSRARPGGHSPVPDAIDGVDQSGTVYAVVDLGGSLRQVQIVAGWWDAVGSHGVAAAVLESLRFARDKAGLARMLLDRHRIPYVVPAPGYQSLFTGDPPRELPDYDAPDFPDELLRKVSRAASVLSSAERLARERDSGEPREVAGPRGMFYVLLRGLSVVGARVNEYALRPEDGDELAADARDALLAARRPFANGWEG
ncbi:hypothetical protein ODJ79_18660 [Actinoplanes sp. KI2]|uniref:hypothetical protein n=1 Tax=Actinoplanes sp. KI2 TaxID=2983315 RepID=UPI0021D5F339|nr:hypothetical protein [Actinoplanes sp. KI2]MCU7725756.1 hypothetical protein [Actinoplanes sp. KI2]